MKHILSLKKTAIILLILAVLAGGLYTYMLARPISYGMSYRNVTPYGDEVFEGVMTFHTDSTMLTGNTNLGIEMESRYYYKNGYVFFTEAKTDEEYAKEVASIDENFDAAIKEPFYADEINAFRLVASEVTSEVTSEGEKLETVYTCDGAVWVAAVGGALELILLTFAALSLILCLRKRSLTESV